ncbi:MmyB family transcriptional regulator [Streptomyces lunaelactis]|uniref:MmyB family transcriptional regulator n=1 Tax=Streptomyces lunaelactis TaxID=1535768 RepID=UPI0035A123D8
MSPPAVRFCHGHARGSAAIPYQTCHRAQDRRGCQREDAHPQRIGGPLAPGSCQPIQEECAECGDADHLAELSDGHQQTAGIGRVLLPHGRAVLATNPAYRELFALSRPAPFRVRNVLWTLFAVPEPFCPLVFRESELPLMVAQLRGAYGRHVGEGASPTRRTTRRATTGYGRCASCVPEGPRGSARSGERGRETRNPAPW